MRIKIFIANKIHDVKRGGGGGGGPALSVTMTSIFPKIVWTCPLKSPQKSTETSNRMLTKFVSIGSYSPEVRTFGTLITSTKVFSYNLQNSLTTPHKRSFT